MRSDKEKMLAGEPYNAGDSELVAARNHARDLCHELNGTRDEQRRRELTTRLLDQGGDTVWLEPPFFCDYGFNIELGSNVYFNFNCVILDVCRVVIGDNVFFGPGVHLYTATHPIQPIPRRSAEFGKPITIGNDVWIGGGAIVCPGINIGSETVIGAGSVVTRSIPDGVVAAGNPCRIIRTLSEEDRRLDR